jgi:hypothetical protein
VNNTTVHIEMDVHKNSFSFSKKEYQEKRSLYAIDDSFKKIGVTKNGMPATRDEKGIVTMDLFTFFMDEKNLDQ